MKLTDRARDILAVTHLFVALLLTLALAGAVDAWL